MGAMALPTAGGATPDASPWPLSLAFGQIACMLNFELADHPVYDGAELQWFDDDIHGTGMLAFLSRRGDRTVDYYQQPQLALDRAGYHIGGGTRSWQDCDFDVARLSVDRDGVDAEVRFCDTDGRLVAVRDSFLSRVCRPCASGPPRRRSAGAGTSRWTGPG